MRASIGARPGAAARRSFGKPYSLRCAADHGDRISSSRIFYCLDALHGERRDRSILFWKSLPVSDLTTVLSKASIPLVVLPLLTFAITVATQWIMLLLSSAVLLASGLAPRRCGHSCRCSRCRWCCSTTWWPCMRSGMRQSTAGCCWSQRWARRAAFLWAALPPLAIGVVEKIAFNTSHFGAMLGYRFGGGLEAVPFTAGHFSMDPMTHSLRVTS